MFCDNSNSGRGLVRIDYIISFIYTGRELHKERDMEKIEIQIQKATERYEKRSAKRDKQLRQLQKKTVFAVDQKERIQFRRSLIDPHDGLARERILGRSDLVGINFLEIGLRVSGSVCRIQVRDLTGRNQGYGTGFMVSSSLLLTNNHVLASPEMTIRSLADFNFEDDENFLPRDTRSFSLEPERFFYTNPALDFTLVAVRPTATDGTSLARFGHLPLLPETGKALLNEYVSIIQHPSGGTKQVALRENRLVDIFGDFVHYETDTLPGSSGSPVFNDQWKVVALHHAGVQKRDAQGRVLAKDGRLWDISMGVDQIAWVANEGIRISSICRVVLEEGQWTPQEQSYIEELRSGNHVPAPAPPPAPIVAVERPIESYSDLKGYDPAFLSQRVDLPTLAKEKQSDRAPLKKGRGHELRYTHFSIGMSKSRRLAYYTAVNIDGKKLRSVPRENGNRWYLDPRMAEKYQPSPELYARNDLDRGHLVRRSDPVWGKQAEQASEDTFHFTNSSPQHKNFNQRTWLDLENHILENTDVHDLKVSVFTGPVFREDDMLYRGKYQIPAEFWKVVVMVKGDGQLSATAYLQTQKNLLEDLEFAFGPYRTYQVPVRRIEALTALDFGPLRDHDPLVSLRSAAGQVINTAEDFKL